MSTDDLEEMRMSRVEVGSSLQTRGCYVPVSSAERLPGACGARGALTCAEVGIAAKASALHFLGLSEGALPT